MQEQESNGLVKESVLDVPRKNISRLAKHIQKLSIPKGGFSTRVLRTARVDRILILLDFFQEDPQVLDPHLSSILPLVISSYLLTIQSSNFRQGEHQTLIYAEAFCKVICAFCKVRGRKVISRFFENEPHFIELLLNTHELLFKVHNNAAEASDSQDPFWHQRYVILLWLAHLALTPFDIVTISGDGAFSGDLYGLSSSSELPLIANQLLEIAMKHLQSPTSQKVVAADLLVRLCLRPDMRKLGLHQEVINWALRRLQSQADDSLGVHGHIGLLTFISGVLNSGALDNVGASMMSAYVGVNDAFEVNGESPQPLQDSAVAKRLRIKVQRDFVVQLLQHRDSPNTTSKHIVSVMLDTRSTLEDVVDSLLTSLSDRDTQVRLAASKALSVIAQKLNQDMADEIVEAVIGCLKEDVLEEDGEKSYAAVNPLRWHGLTMTLSHMLFRRTPSPGQMQDVLKALFMSLTFEQTASSGNSVGGNVRDAANFGLWSLARRYSTSELSTNVSFNAITTAAKNLVCSACFDPVGNIRRGSSAALQELVGRHPDTIENGISLIQIVDYLGVGLRSRAMIEIAPKAANLSSQYLQALVEAIYGWRGTCANDQLSRELASTAIERLSKLQDRSDHRAQFHRCAKLLREISVREVESRHGLLLGLSSLISTTLISERERGAKVDLNPESADRRYALELLDICEYCRENLDLEVALLKSPSRRTDLTALGVIQFVKAVAILSSIARPWSTSRSPRNTQILDLFTAALQAVNDEAIGKIREVCHALFIDGPHSTVTSSTWQRAPLAGHILIDLAEDWLQVMDSAYSLDRIPGLQISLGVAWSAWSLHEESSEVDKFAIFQQRIFGTLNRNAQPPTRMDIRAIAVQALEHIILDTHENHDYTVALLETLHLALIDFTVTERGDVGSLVRTEALTMMRTFWQTPNCDVSTNIAFDCYLNTIKLALGKLDKVRLEAVEALTCTSRHGLLSYPRDAAIDINSTSALSHFALFADLISKPSPYTKLASSQEAKEDLTHRELLAVLEGFIISAGSGTSTTLPSARSVLADTLNSLPTYSPPDKAHMRSIYVVANALITLLSTSQTEDRVLVPLLETIAYLLDFNILQRLSQPPPPDGAEATEQPFHWRKLLSLVQKAHFKSTSLPKLLAAVNVYAGLAEVQEIRKEVLKKLVSMLGHPFIKIRAAVGEVLWAVTAEEGLKDRNWGDEPKRHAQWVDGFRRRVVGE